MADQIADLKAQVGNLPSKPRTFGVLFGCAKGAVLVSVLIQFPGCLYKALTGRFGDSSQLGSWLTGLGETIGLMVTTAFTTPWPLLGALAGLSVALYNLRHEEQSAIPRQDGPAPAPRRFMPGEPSLAAGMLLTLVSVGIFPSVMVWMLAVFTLPLGVLLGVSGLINIRKRTPVTGAPIGFATLLVAAVGMIMGALACTSLSCVMIDALGLAPALEPELGGGWLVLLACWAMAVLAAHRGLQTWTDWTPGHRRFWVLAVALFPVAAFLLHFSLATIGLLPLSA
jgi:hypothetical protein